MLLPVIGEWPLSIIDYWLQTTGNGTKKGARECRFTVFRLLEAKFGDHPLWNNYTFPDSHKFVFHRENQGTILFHATLSCVKNCEKDLKWSVFGE